MKAAGGIKLPITRQAILSLHLAGTLKTQHRSAVGAGNAHFFIGRGWENEGRLINAFKGSY